VKYSGRYSKKSIHIVYDRVTHIEMEKGQNAQNPELIGDRFFHKFPTKPPCYSVPKGSYIETPDGMRHRITTSSLLICGTTNLSTGRELKH